MLELHDYEGVVAGPSPSTARETLKLNADAFW